MNQKTTNKLDKYIILSITLIIIYTIVALVFTYLFRSPPAELTTCVYAFFGTELVSGIFIKKFNNDKEIKEIEENKKEELEDLAKKFLEENDV